LERIAEAGSLHPKDVKIPGVLVDCVVVSTTRTPTRKTWGTQYSPAMSGELRVPAVVGTAAGAVGTPR